MSAYSFSFLPAILKGDQAVPTLLLSLHEEISLGDYGFQSLFSPYSWPLFSFCISPEMRHQELSRIPQVGSLQQREEGRPTLAVDVQPEVASAPWKLCSHWLLMVTLRSTETPKSLLF